MTRRLLISGVVLLLTGPAWAADSASDDVSIPFANMGGIYDWSADGNSALYIESLNKQWYHAQLLGPCIGLPFAQRVGFVSEPGSGAFDKFSSILVDGQECPLKSIMKSGPPPSKAKHWRSKGASSNGATTNAPK